MFNQETNSLFVRLMPIHSTGQPYKLSLNRNISDTLLRKAAQLVNDIENINKHNDTATSLLTAAQTQQEKTIKTAIDSILDIRKSLGITIPAGSTDGVKTLQQYLEKRGTILNVKS